MSEFQPFLMASYISKHEWNKRKRLRSREGYNHVMGKRDSWYLDYDTEPSAVWVCVLGVEVSFCW